MDMVRFTREKNRDRKTVGDIPSLPQIDQVLPGELHDNSTFRDILEGYGMHGTKCMLEAVLHDTDMDIVVGIDLGLQMVALSSVDCDDVVRKTAVQLVIDGFRTVVGDLGIKGIVSPEQTVYHTKHTRSGKCDQTFENVA